MCKFEVELDSHMRYTAAGSLEKPHEDNCAGPCHRHFELVLRTTHPGDVRSFPIYAAREPRVLIFTAQRVTYLVTGSSTANISTSTVYRAYPGDLFLLIPALKSLVHHGYLEAEEKYLLFSVLPKECLRRKAANTRSKRYALFYYASPTDWHGTLTVKGGSHCRPLCPLRLLTLLDNQMPLGQPIPPQRSEGDDYGDYDYPDCAETAEEGNSVFLTVPIEATPSISGGKRARMRSY
ncbi:hypothetical protein FIBSPDRAFT_928864 [Athelia psychrophila]|uniref:Uncharacterized protein n=1 Tax=Athelia psychrophila TaxID=1759441 RepID=A0A166PKD7_9AGAM|nr:hypothetical protein FIBSPDRAFT_928864 [Fibularhizoctonia sp. CBS 109695]